MAGRSLMARLAVLVIAFFAMAAIDLSGCFPVMCDCQGRRDVWTGSISRQCGPAGGIALEIRFDIDTIPEASRRYRIYPVYVPMDSLREEMVLSDTLELCEGAACRNEAVSIRLTKVSSLTVNGDLTIREVAKDASYFPYLRLRKDMASPPHSCI